MIEKKTLHTNIDAVLLKKLKFAAVEQDKALNELIEEILKDYFNRLEG